MTSKTLRSVAADANVLLSAALGHAARKVFEKARVFHVVTPEAAAAEVREHLPSVAREHRLDRAELLEAFDLLPIEVVPEEGYRARLKEAERLMARRDPDDAPVLALALRRRLPIWSNDNDFDHTGVTVYPTAVLLKILGFSSRPPR